MRTGTTKNFLGEEFKVWVPIKVGKMFIKESRISERAKEVLATDFKMKVNYTDGDGNTIMVSVDGRMAAQIEKYPSESKERDLPARHQKFVTHY
jgi:hypothetical protein